MKPKSITSLPNLPQIKVRQKDPKMMSRRVTPLPMQKQSTGSQKNQYLACLGSIENWRTNWQSTNKCREVSTAQPQTHRETMQKSLERKASSIPKNPCNSYQRKKETRDGICRCQIIEKISSLSLEQRTSSQATCKWKVPSKARSQRIKYGSSLEIGTNKICSTIEVGKTFANLPLSQIVPCQEKETSTEEAAARL